MYEFYYDNSYKCKCRRKSFPVNISVKLCQTEARRILDMINELRTSPTDAWAWDKTDTKQVAYPGLKELVYDYDLERLAMKRAAEIALSYEQHPPKWSKSFYYLY